ncbi:unnamed protein product [Didymodactylos carnosus]|uniref:Apolipoprotein L3 n=1 Tax=Didymodactylos carnosus TaxID=1234261 RepID=A0A813ZTA4_9BILA|nr:unnamed protein product [Didymodactylos carnosus]CAF0904159.1 unnamed protein product [Didymodactylos carnosus]CAF3530151.1 unnamed protein product [Didymodactylos carnosus]CAF3686208.1 unnamed protein product [Didymodactylos carnosus]
MTDYQELNTLVKEFVDKRADLISYIQQLADNLDSHHKNVHIAKTVGSGAAVLGTVVGTAGILFSVLTGGLSLLATGAIVASSAGVIATGGMAAVGATVTEAVITKNKLQELSDKCANDEEKVSQIKEHIENLINIEQNEYFSNRKTTLEITNNFVAIGNKQITYTVVRIAATSLIVKVITLEASVAAGIVTAPIHVIDLQKSAKALSNGEKHDTSDQLRNLAEQLKQESENMQEAVKKLIKEN